MEDNNNIIINENLLQKNNNKEERDTQVIENEMKIFMATEEGEKIKADIDQLIEMGYDKKIINKVYILLHPENIEHAIDYMTEVNGVYQHNFFESHNPKKDKNLCFICKKIKRYHLDYIPEDVLVDANNNQNNFEIDIIEEDNHNHSSDFNNESNKNISNEKQNFISNECSVCFDEITEDEKNFNSLPCGHICCTQCWLNYLKTLITEAKVDQIKCIEHKCINIIPEEFILKHINDDKTLVSKYQKFKKRSDIINDKNKKQCPRPDCESFLQKSNTTNYVKCENGHKYCYECLRPPHGKSKCENVLEKEFLKWKKHRRVKRCPRCKIFTEKNEGCNHMTCVSCKYQWCWLCEGKYTYSHYSSGKCQGLQFTRADNLKQARGRICFITLHNIFPCYYKKITRALNLGNIFLRYLSILVFYIIGFFLFAGFNMLEYTDNYIDKMTWSENVFYFFGFFIALSLFVCFQILFTCLITPFILICLFYPYFIDYILTFLNIGETY